MSRRSSRFSVCSSELRAAAEFCKLHASGSAQHLPGFTLGMELQGWSLAMDNGGYSLLPKEWSIIFLYVFQGDSRRLRKLRTGHISVLRITATIPISTVWTFRMGSKELKKHYSVISLASQGSY